MPTEQSVSKKNLIERGERVRTVRGMLRMTIMEFAELCNSGESTIRVWEQAKASGLTRKGANKISMALGSTPIICSAEWLLTGKGEPPRITGKEETPLTVESDLGNHTDDAIIQNEIASFNQRTKDCMVCCIQDDAMEPYYKQGDFVAGNRFYGDDIKNFIGEMCIVQTITGQMFLRRIHSQIDKKYRLVTLNINSASAPVIDTELVFAAPITRLWRPRTYLSIKQNSPNPH